MDEESLFPQNFKHKYVVTVRFHEVDMLGVCNNAVYINFFETARLEYIKAAGLMPEKGIFSDGKIFFMVRNEINYRSHAYYDDVLDVYSKISYIKNSSFGYDHLIVKQKTGEIIVDGKGVVVFVDPKTRKSTTLPENFIEKVKAFEPTVRILRE
jgi:acyl-CoA thioester hydrolase